MYCIIYEQIYITSGSATPAFCLGARLAHQKNDVRNDEQNSEALCGTAEVFPHLVRYLHKEHQSSDTTLQSSQTNTTHPMQWHFISGHTL